MIETEYYAGEFTDAELNCQADIAGYPRAIEEFFLEHERHMTNRNERRFGGILRSHDR
jgi:hypothetical protein